MSGLPYIPEDLRLLIDAAMDGSITPRQAGELQTFLEHNREACRIYAEYARIEAELHLLVRGRMANQAVCRGISALWPTDGAISGGQGFAVPPSSSFMPGFLGGLRQGTVAIFSQIGPLSYLIATLILGVMLLGAWAYKITHYQQIVDNRPPSINRPEMQFVGHITGMTNCRWSDPDTGTINGASVPLGRRYALASGLMEITYKSGAKVILEGPCTYEVESPAGGYLSLGKLTARVGERGEGRGESEKSVVSGQWSVASAKPQAANLQISKSPNLQIPNQQIPSPLSPLPSPFFSVRTPTAIVTDLGTEFGVEVSAEGNTASHVFRGSVKVQTIGNEHRQGVILHENESARVEKRDGRHLLTRRAAGEAPGFVLEMPPPKCVRDSKAYAKLVLSLKPVVYFRMERPKDEKDNRMVTDSAGGGHHGELRLGNEYGSPYVPGRFGNALWLRGPAVGDRAIVYDYPRAVDDRLTVSAWVLPIDRPGWAMIASDWCRPRPGASEIGQFLFGLYRRDGDLFIEIMQPDQRQIQLREGADHPFPMGSWQHVAFAIDGTVARLYHNGVEVAAAACDGVLKEPPLSNLGIGCRINNESGTDAIPNTFGYNYWQGRIDELAVFHRALPAETIRQLYLGGSDLPGGRDKITTTQGKETKP